MDSILVVDDEAGIRFAIRDILQTEQLTVFSASNTSEALQVLQQESPLVLLLDIRLGGECGLEFFSRIRRIAPKVLVIFITGQGSAELAIETIKMGAFDYLAKPLDLDQLAAAVAQAVKIAQLMRVPATVEGAPSQRSESDRLMGTGPMMQALCKQIGRLAPQDLNLLILGESGTGKELVARAIYQHSRRAEAPYLAINCAAIPEGLLESELFGHEQGAFTGADRRRIGKFEQCHEGTIFLDEVGDMPLATQAKILRLLQDGQFQRVGGNVSVSTNVRVIAATHQNLELMIADGRFRRDLYYRLRGATLNLPPLRERKEDIPELAHYFLFRFNRQLRTTIQSISPEALDKMQAYHWPGNVRELQGAVRESMILSTGPTLLPDFLPSELQSDRLNDAEGVSVNDLGPIQKDAWQKLGITIEQWVREHRGDLYRRSVQLFDRHLLRVVMEHSRGHLGNTAELLGLSRPTLRTKIRAVLTDHQDD